MAGMAPRVRVTLIINIGENPIKQLVRWSVFQNSQQDGHSSIVGDVSTNKFTEGSAVFIPSGSQ